VIPEAVEEENGENGGQEMTDTEPIREALLAMEGDRLKTLVQEALEQGLPAKDILNRGLIAAMDIVGDKMEKGDMFIPEVLMCARVMGEAIGILKPHLSAEESSASSRVVIGTVKGDLHDIGKNLVAMMLQSGGFEVVNLGIDVAPEAFVESLREHRPHILALSALLTTTMPMLGETIEAVKKSGLRSSVTIVVGGAPVNKEFARSIGADGYAPDAGGALKLLKSIPQGLSRRSV
jgi:5-methyltetrahydrofolate--homocysteine methyltransferase